MRWFRRTKPQERPCPQCSKLLALDAVTCDLCGADLKDFPVTRPVSIQAPAGGRRQG